MKALEEKLDLSFPVKAVVDGEKWEGPFAELIKRPTVVSVYMRNNTSSCDKQTVQMQTVAEELDKKGIGLIGLSKDTVGSHLKYAAKHGLSFPLVSDPDHLFAQATDSLVEKKMYGKTFLGPTRSAYLLRDDLSLAAAVEKVTSAAHGDELLSLVKEI
ncbi:peroxiredoxin [Pelagicoccus albus]|uniref:thioredoxin-dependent peroxiredoxin n=1 Tax=Pelagicoccus albus TaxID=415222 RepID=A0A7X1B784_9BACT|nr:redoxin domain-containing protein [Pelagicoccus albus]MBC2606968.1 redoxin domain-containing protein [Pelagicoccus albus]